nr:hypothetical protein GCM10020092_033300 [Actinoplanes digitatis]
MKWSMSVIATAGAGSATSRDGRFFVDVAAISQAGQGIAAGFLAETLSLLEGLGGFKHRIPALRLGLPLPGAEAFLGGEALLLRGERLRVVTARSVQLGLLLVYPDHDLVQFALLAESARRVQAGLGSAGRAQAALRAGQSEQKFGHVVGVVAEPGLVAGDAQLHRLLGLGVLAVRDLDRADRVQLRRVELDAVRIGVLHQPAGHVLSPREVAGGVLGVSPVVEHDTQPVPLLCFPGQHLDLAEAQPGRVDRAAASERVGQLGLVSDLHVRAGGFIEQLDRAQRVIQALGLITGKPGEVRAGEMGPGLEEAVAVPGGPCVDAINLPGTPGDVSAAQEQVGSAESSTRYERLVAECHGLLFEIGCGAGAASASRMTSSSIASRAAETSAALIALPSNVAPPAVSSARAAPR